jgi:hypothetical protein
MRSLRYIILAILFNKIIVQIADSGLISQDLETPFNYNSIDKIPGANLKMEQ